MISYRLSAANVLCFYCRIYYRCFAVRAQPMLRTFMVDCSGHGERPFNFIRVSRLSFSSFEFSVVARPTFPKFCRRREYVNSRRMAPWKNRISSITIKLRKLLVKPVTRQNISSCLVLPPEIVMLDALMSFSERPPIYASSCMTISGGRTEQHVVIGFGELAAVD